MSAFAKPGTPRGDTVCTLTMAQIYKIIRDRLEYYHPDRNDPDAFTQNVVWVEMEKAMGIHPNVATVTSPDLVDATAYAFEALPDQFAKLAKGLLDDYKKRVFFRVYELPDKLTDGYCFGRGKPITFLNVDWIEAPQEDFPDKVVEFLKTKQYYKPGRKYLVIGDADGCTFRFE